MLEDAKLSAGKKQKDTERENGSRTRIREISSGTREREHKKNEEKPVEEGGGKEGRREKMSMGDLGRFKERKERFS